MDWPISPAGHQAATAAATDPAAAVKPFKALPIADALGVCARVAEHGGHPAFKSFANAFWASASSPGAGLNRSAFAVRVAEAGFVPLDETLGVDPLDYQFARQFILKVRDDPRLANALGWPPDPRAVATTRPFYPEAVRGVTAWRQRICAVAAAHRDKGPISPQQWALLSLGSFYPFSRAKAGAQPGGGNGSVLFARSVLHAAGCNVIRPGTSLTCDTADGLFGALPREAFGYTRASMMDIGVRPEMGDVYHIQGANFEDREGNRTVDSTHVGVILGVWGNIWLTIEGGSADGVTRQRTRELVPVQSGLGKWAFKFDDAFGKIGHRPLQGWFSVSRIRADRWMPVVPDAFA